jgi:hypothetical protein
MEFSTEEIRATVRFYALQGLPSTEIRQNLLGVYGDRTPSYSAVSRLATQFKCGRKEIANLPRGRPPDVATCDEMCQRVDTLVKTDRRVTIRSISDTFGISTERVHFILHKKLGLSRICARWVPRLLTETQK